MGNGQLRTVVEEERLECLERQPAKRPGSGEAARRVKLQEETRDVLCWVKQRLGGFLVREQRECAFVIQEPTSQASA